MPMCPHCHTVVSGDYQFCPECGRPLATGQVVVEGRVEGKSKKKLAGIIVGCIIATIVIVVIATRPPAALEPEPAIPSYFTTYTDELGLFSISYPPGWSPDLELIAETEQSIRDVISSISSDLPVENVSVIFLAREATDPASLPAVSVLIEPCPLVICTHDAVVRAEIEGGKEIWSDYYDLSQVKTTIDNRTATIIEFQNTVGSLTYRGVQMLLLVNRTVWVVTCSVWPDEYSEWEDEFDAIVRSLRILN